MFKVIFRVLLIPAAIAYVVTTVKMVLGMKQFQAESATADDAQLKTLAAKRWDPFLVNTVLAVFIIWHIQPLVTPHHHGVWFVINAFVAWVVTTFLWEMEWYSTKLFVPLKVTSQVLLYGSCINATFAKIGISILTIVLGIIFFRKHRENWIVALVIVVCGVYALMRSMTIPGAAKMVWLAIELALFIYFLVSLTKSGKSGKVVCAIIMAYLAFKVFHNARNLYYLFIFRG